MIHELAFAFSSDVSIQESKTRVDFFWMAAMKGRQSAIEEYLINKKKK